jgi:hypothetical protein
MIRTKREDFLKDQTNRKRYGQFFWKYRRPVYPDLPHIGNGYIYAFFIIGACLLAAGGLVRRQVRRIEKILARDKAEEDARGRSGPGFNETGTSETP